jgi:orotate phosphoribosyltransferase-like protein
MANKHKFSRQQAVELRQQGMSYKQIATELGCSEAWCCKELVGVEKGVYVDNTDPLQVKAEAIRILQDALTELRKI